MGCSMSKADDEPVVSMCKERKHFIKQAVDQRYALAAAHVEYLQALGGIGEALRVFAQGETQLLSSSVPPSPVISSSEKKSSEPVAGPDKSSTTSSLHLHSDSHSHHSDSHSHHSHSHSASPAASPASPLQDYGHWESPSTYTSPPRMDYLRSGGTPSRTYEERPRSPERATWDFSGASNMDSFFGNPLPSAPAPASPPGPSYSPNHPPPPPPPSSNQAWDFFNPFISDENMYPFYNQSRPRSASEGSSRDSSRVREEEGIPDLEDEDQGEDTKTKLQRDIKAAGKSQATDTRSADPVAETSVRSVAHPEPEESVEEKVPTNTGEDEDREKNKGQTGALPVDEAAVESGAPSGGNNDQAPFVTQRTRDLVEVIKEIEDQFKRAQDSGKEVSKMLETNRVPYRPRYSLLKALSARVLNAITWHRAKSSVPSSSKQPHSSKPKKYIDAYNNDLDDDTGMVSGSHASTLDKIYAWEKKLYEEVKAGEMIRIEYDKKCRQLKHHDDKGVDHRLVDATTTAIRTLKTRIKVAIQVVDSISKRIHKLRDEELRPQLSELLEGFIRMWRVMFDCHRIQSRIISEAKFQGRLAASVTLSESHRKATRQLDNELRNWQMCFRNWSEAQKAYVQALNGWLLKCLHYEPETTPDGIVPFSPRRVGAPPVFIICNDWFHAFERIPASVVVETIGKFAAEVSEVWKRQDEEHHKRRRAEMLARDLERRVKEESKLHGIQPPSDKKIESGTGQSGIGSELKSIDSFRRQVEQENTKHREFLQETHDFTLNSLRTSLKNVFEQITQFTAISLKSYEELSVQPGSQSLPQGNGEISYIKDT